MDTLELVLLLAVDTLELALVLGPLVAVALLTLETELVPARLVPLLAVGSFPSLLRVQRVSPAAFACVAQQTLAALAAPRRCAQTKVFSAPFSV